MPLPAFHPPPGQTRSSSIWTPSLIRKLACETPLGGNNCLSASRENEVGTTQLFVSGIQGQPNLSGSKRTCRSVVRNFHFHSQCDSSPAESMSQAKAFNSSGIGSILL